MSLATHLATDPDGRGYAQMSNYEVWQDLYTKRRAGVRQVSLKEFGDLVDTNIAGRVLTAMATYGAGATDDAPLVQSWLDLLKSPSGTINVHNAKVQAMLQGFEAAGLLQAGDSAAVIALADNQVSDAEFYGFGRLRPSQIADARA